MKDEEIKLPELPNQGFGETRSRGVSTKFYDEHTVRNLMREAVRLNQSQAEPLPFNIEAAKRGELVLHNGQEKRWIGHSCLDNCLNIVEGEDGLDYASDGGLFMKPKPMRTAYVCVYKTGKLEIFDDRITAGRHAAQYGISIFEVQIPDVR